MAEFHDGSFDQSLAQLAIRQIAADVTARRPRFFQCVENILAIGILCDHGDSGASFRQFDGDFAAKPAPSAGNNCTFSRKIHVIDHAVIDRELLVDPADHDILVYRLIFPPDEIPDGAIEGEVKS